MMDEGEQFVPLTQVVSNADEQGVLTQARVETKSAHASSSEAANAAFETHGFQTSGATQTSSVEKLKGVQKRKGFKFPPPAKSIGKQHWTRTSYFTMRQKKLETQAPQSETCILSGVTVYFTGVKSMSQRKLEGLVWRNGGVVQKVWLRRQVTHVIADNLAASKVEKELQVDVKNCAVVVKPSWITESLKQGSKLPTWQFRVVKGPPDVRDVASYFRHNKGTNRDKVCK